MRFKIDTPLIPMGLGIALRLIHLKSALSGPVLKILIIDSASYHAWALEIAGGNIMGEGMFFLSPLYPYVLGFLYALFGSHAAVAALFQITLSAAGIYLIWWIGNSIGGKTAGITAAFIAAVYPPWIYFDSAVMTASLIIFLNTAALAAIIKWFDHPQPGYIFLAGALIGLSALARPSALLFAAVVAVWLLKRRLHMGAVLLAVGIITAIAPVTIRNVFVGGEFALTTVSGGMNFYVGNNPEATGLYVEPDFIVSSDPDTEFESYHQEAERRSWKKLSNTGASRWWYMSSLQFIIRQPVQAAGIWWNKFFYFWNELEAPNNVSFYLVMRSSPLLKYLPLGFGVLAVLGVIGLAGAPACRGRTLLWIYLFSILAANLLFFTSSEFRFPVVIALAVGGGIAALRIARAVREKRYRWGLIVLGAAGLLFTHYRTDLSQALRSPRMDFYNYGSVCLKEGKLKSAGNFFILSLAEDPGFIEAHMGLGTTYLEMDEFEAAAMEFKAAGFPVSAEYLKKNRSILEDFDREAKKGFEDSNP